MTENYFLENFGALSAQEKIDRGVRKEELQGLEGEQLLELALEKTIESPFGGPVLHFTPLLHINDGG